MVKIVARRRGGRTYYYMRYGRKKEIYLGKTLPKNAKEMLEDAYRKEWYAKLEEIREGYAKEIRTKPRSLVEKELEQFCILFTYDTQRIEGSTLTLRDTAMLLGEGRTPTNKPIGDVREAEAHRDLFAEMLRLKSDLTLSVVCEWHRKLFAETKPDISGRIRKSEVQIAGSKHKPPRAEALRYLLTSFFRWYKGKQSKRLNPVERAALVHLKFVSIHPFGDGNGRISRIMMNHTLSKSEYPMVSINYKDRRSYYNALERSQSKGDDMIFVQWFMRRYLKTYKKYWYKH